MRKVSVLTFFLMMSLLFLPSNFVMATETNAYNGEANIGFYGTYATSESSSSMSTTTSESTASTSSITSVSTSNTSNNKESDKGTIIPKFGDSNRASQWILTGIGYVLLGVSMYLISNQKVRNKK